ncbi:phage portal protein [Cupriavidus necator]|uniref:phage portal protein n=1 Tax=Cupriavidus necator TaxID=106590 RepID=UPI001F176B00|nr:phage portal protein [Cupriavidus necator]
MTIYGTVHRILDDTIGTSLALAANRDYRALALRSGVAAFDAAWADKFRRTAEALWRGYAENADRSMSVARQLALGDGFLRVIHDCDRFRAGKHRGVGVFAPVPLQASIIASIFGTFISSPYDPALVQDAVAANGESWQLAKRRWAWSNDHDDDMPRAEAATLGVCGGITARCSAAIGIRRADGHGSVQAMPGQGHHGAAAPVLSRRNSAVRDRANRCRKIGAREFGGAGSH